MRSFHMVENPYQCQYCSSRFRNKDEAERHCNSLHIRRHFWSCAAISADDIFHLSMSNPVSLVCGYCGTGFPVDYGGRVQHLSEIHKYRECNQSKKFYREDHFRQHLRHSHMATCGKWTGIITNACIKEGPVAGVVQSSQAPSYSHFEAQKTMASVPRAVKAVRRLLGGRRQHVE